MFHHSFTVLISHSDGRAHTICSEIDFVSHFLRLILGNLAAWSHGSCIVYPSETFDPPAVVDAIINEKCTALHGVPTHFLGVLGEVEKRQQAGEKLDVSRLRWERLSFIPLKA